jgi:ankyrin repeat protein
MSDFASFYANNQPLSAKTIKKAKRNGVNFAGAVFHVAAKGDVESVLALAAAGVDIDEKWNGATALHIAAQKGRNEVVQTLLKKGAAIDQKCNNGATALHLAAQYGHNEVVQTLLMMEAAVNEKSERGNTALHFAAQSGRNDVVQTLLMKGAAIDEKNNNGWTPLHLASLNGHNRMVQALLASDATVDEMNNSGATALHIAAQYGHNELVLTLLKMKAVVDKINNDGCSALHIAAHNGHYEVVQTLLVYKATIDKENGLTPLHVAAHYGHNEIVQSLLMKKAAIDEMTERGNTALHLAAQEGRNEVVQTLLKAMVPIDKKNNIGATALHLAAQNGHNEVVQTLLKNAAASDEKDNEGWSALPIAAWKGHKDVVQTLIKNKTEIDNHVHAMSPSRQVGTLAQAAAATANVVPNVVRLGLHELQISETTVGRGAFGAVYRGTWSDRAVAVKRLHPQNTISTDRPLAEIRREFLCEIELMATIAAHDNVVQLFGWAQLEGGAIGAVMELCEGGALVHTLYGGDERLRLAWSAAQRVSVALDAARGLAHLHRQSIVHRDIAARNVMLTILGADRRVGKLGDFGRARRCEGESVDESDGANGFKWMAPEQMGEQRRHSTAASDVFSFGVLVYEIFACEAPWVGVHVLAVRRDVSEGKRETIPEGVPEAVARLIGNCWAHAPGDRPTMTECVEDIVSYRRFAV